MKKILINYHINPPVEYSYHYHSVGDCDDDSRNNLDVMGPFLHPQSPAYENLTERPIITQMDPLRYVWER